MSSKTSNDKLREALTEIIDTISQWRIDGAMEHWQYSRLFDIADTALALPRRNCDVGTAEEQTERYTKFCESHRDTHGNCILCPACKMVGRCEFHWSQMPYEEVRDAD